MNHVASSSSVLRRAARVFLAAARRDETSGVVVFDRELRVVAASGSLLPDPLPFCRRALRGEAYRAVDDEGWELRACPIRDELGRIVGGVMVSYDVSALSLVRAAS